MYRNFAILVAIKEFIMMYIWNSYIVQVSSASEFNVMKI